MGHPSPVQSTEQHSRRSATVEELRELLRRQGKGDLLVTSTAAGESEGERKGDNTFWEIEPGTLGVISGAWSSGKTSLALEQAARLTRSGERAAIVDGKGWLFPPALALMEADLARLLMLRPSPAKTIWAAEQILRTGLFALVLLLEPPRLDRAALRRLQLAAERGRSRGMLVPRSANPPVAGLVALRLTVEANFSSPASSPSPADTTGDLASVIAAPPRRYRVKVVRRGQGDARVVKGVGVKMGKWGKNHQRDKMEKMDEMDKMDKIMGRAEGALG